MRYQSREYALSQKEDKRHFKELVDFLGIGKKDKILEIGCSRGFLAKRVKEVASETWGIDINAAAIKNAVTGNLKVMLAEKLEFRNESFDKIYSFHTLEHIPDIKKTIKEIERVLKPGGKLLLVYPAEPVRGLFALGTSLILFKNPFRAREIHKHKLSPSIIKKLILGSKLKCIKNKFSFFSSPQFFTLLEKRI